MQFDLERAEALRRLGVTREWTDPATGFINFEMADGSLRRIDPLALQHNDLPTYLGQLIETAEVIGRPKFSAGALGAASFPGLRMRYPHGR